MLARILQRLESSEIAAAGILERRDGKFWELRLVRERAVRRRVRVESGAGISHRYAAGSEMKGWNRGKLIGWALEISWLSNAGNLDGSASAESALSPRD